MIKNKVTVVFPMAGDGTRFGSGYKPLCKIAEEYFIEAAVRPFIKWDDFIEKYKNEYILDINPYLK